MTKMKPSLTNRSVVVPASYALIFDQNRKILVGRRQNTGYRDGLLTVPSGHIEENETPLQALIREVKEETGMDFSFKDWVFEFCLFRKSETEDERVDFFFSADLGGRNPKNTEPFKCKELLWTDPNSLHEDVFDYIKFVLKKMRVRERFGVFGYNQLT